MRQHRISMLVIVLLLAGTAMVRAQDFGRDAFRDRWERTDYPVQQGRADHSWIWGPEPFTQVLFEWYVDAPNESRPVQYIDKSRMEIIDPDADQDDEWYVTNGLLARSLIDGQVQVGDEKFIPLQPASIAVAGDLDNDFPTYADLQRIVGRPADLQVGEHASQQMTPDGFANLQQYAERPETEIVHVERDYGIPRVFWDFMNQGGTVFRDGQFVRSTPLFNWLYVVGYPLAEPYWTRVQVGGIERDVMFQPFERRVLTYTPDNPEQYRVEMGNVGRHYYEWRYVQPFADDRQALIASPRGEQPAVQSPLVVQGFENGAAFEAAVQVRLVAEDGNVLARESTMVHRPDIGIPGPFEVTLNFDAPEQNTPGTIEVFVLSPRDGTETVIASQDVVIRGTAAEPVPQAILDRVLPDLAQRLGIGEDEVTVAQAQAVEWRNAALECPAPDQLYAPVITPGYRIVLEAQGQTYEYRTDAQGANVVLCRDGQPVPR